MRTSRVDKFKKIRHVKRRKFFLYAIVLPCMCIFAGYLITALFILPSLTK